MDEMNKLSKLFRALKDEPYFFVPTKVGKVRKIKGSDSNPLFLVGTGVYLAYKDQRPRYLGQYRG